MLEQDDPVGIFILDLEKAFERPPYDLIWI